MLVELTARTSRGTRLVATAETLAAGFAGRPGPDRAGRLAAVRRSHFLAAPIPGSRGGLGVASVHDLVVASNRLSRGDAALGAFVNQHLAGVVSAVRAWRRAVRGGGGERFAVLEEVMRAVAREGLVLVGLPAGDAAARADHQIVSRLLAAGTSLGAAEAAGAGSGPDVVGLWAARSSLSRAAALADAHPAKAMPAGLDCELDAVEWRIAQIAPDPAGDLAGASPGLSSRAG